MNILIFFKVKNTQYCYQKRYESTTNTIVISSYLLNNFIYFESSFVYSGNVFLEQSAFVYNNW